MDMNIYFVFQIVLFIHHIWINLFMLAKKMDEAYTYKNRRTRNVQLWLEDFAVRHAK